MNNPTTYRLRQLTKHIPPLVYQLPEEVLTAKPNPGKWSKKEIVGHLVDSAINNHIRFVRLRFELSPLTIEGYAQDDWVRAHQYQCWPTDVLLDAWRSQQQQITELMQQVSSEELQRNCQLSNGSLETFDWLYQDYVAHLEHHLHQIVSYDW